MLQQWVMCSALRTTAAILGGFGVFCVIYSFAIPDLGAKALILLGTAIAMVCLIDC